MRMSTNETVHNTRPATAADKVALTYAPGLIGSKPGSIANILLSNCKH